MIVLVCGGRDFKDKDYVFEVLDQFHSVQRITKVIHGNAKGADSLASLWATKRNILQIPYPANWTKYGSSAGPVRNEWMLLHGKPDHVIAFTGGNGTVDMIRKAQAVGLPVTLAGSR